jgi:hypothetical protein
MDFIRTGLPEIKGMKENKKAKREEWINIHTKMD